MNLAHISDEVDQILIHLRQSMKQRRFSQVRVQKELGWKGSYISQLLNRTKALRVEQLLAILSVIDYRPVDFFCEVYNEPERVRIQEICTPQELQVCFQMIADNLRSCLEREKR